MVYSMTYCKHQGVEPTLAGTVLNMARRYESSEVYLMRLPLCAAILLLSLSWSFPLSADRQTDASAAAARAYKEKNYAEYLRNVR